MKIDVHTHVFHPKIARKAIAHLNAHYGVRCAGDGTLAGLLECERRVPVDRCVILCAATTPEQVMPSNRFAMRLQAEDERVIAFGTLHPGFADWERELERLKRAGIRGIKLHPDFQGFRLDDARLLPIFEAMQGEFILTVHVGDALPPEENPSCPYKLASILRAFPSLTVIGAHLGGFRMWEHAQRVLGGGRYANLWLDTSSVAPILQGPDLTALVRAFPEERLLFGSDWPLWDPVEEVARLRFQPGLGDAFVERVLRNGEALFRAFGL